MKTEEQIQEEIKKLEKEALDRIRDGYTHLKYALVYKLTTLKWVLEEDLKGEQEK